IIGGGEEGDKLAVRTKEEADHSLPYLIAVALLDGEVMPAQFAPQRIERADVQTLLRRVVIRPSAELSRRFPAEMPCRIALFLADGSVHRIEKRDYVDFVTRPATWDGAVTKFEVLSAPHADPALRRAICEAVSTLDAIPVSALTSLLASAGTEETR